MGVEKEVGCNQTRRLEMAVAHGFCHAAVCSEQEHSIAVWMW